MHDCYALHEPAVCRAAGSCTWIWAGWPAGLAVTANDACFCPYMSSCATMPMLPYLRLSSALPACPHASDLAYSCVCLRACRCFTHCPPSACIVCMYWTRPRTHRMCWASSHPQMYCRCCWQHTTGTSSIDSCAGVHEPGWQAWIVYRRNRCSFECAQTVFAALHSHSVQQAFCRVTSIHSMCLQGAQLSMSYGFTQLCAARSRHWMCSFAC